MQSQWWCIHPHPSFCGAACDGIVSCLVIRGGGRCGLVLCDLWFIWEICVSSAFGGRGGAIFNFTDLRCWFSEECSQLFRLKFSFSLAGSHPPYVGARFKWMVRVWKAQSLRSSLQPAELSDQEAIPERRQATPPRMMD